MVQGAWCSFYCCRIHTHPTTSAWNTALGEDVEKRFWVRPISLNPFQQCHSRKEHFEFFMLLLLYATISFIFQFHIPGTNSSLTCACACVEGLDVVPINRFKEWLCMRNTRFSSSVELREWSSFSPFRHLCVCSSSHRSRQRMVFRRGLVWRDRAETGHSSAI